MKNLISLSLVLTLLACVAGGCGGGASPTPLPPEPTATPVPSAQTPVPSATPSVAPAEPPAPALKISSSAFEPGGEMPTRHSCEGQNLSPPLEWTGVPEETQSLALVVEDPDSVPPGFTHWLVYNMPPTTGGFPEGVPAEGTLNDGTLQGTNDFAAFGGATFPSGATINKIGYDGPCPPSPHHYVFTLYALDTDLALPAEANAAQVLAAMEGHILAQAEVKATYSPQG